MRKQSVLYSICIHAAVITSLLLLAMLPATTTRKLDSSTTLHHNPTPLYAPKLRTAAEVGSKGGGQKNPLPPARGAIPKVAKVFIAPTLRPLIQPKIELPSGLEDMPVVAANVPIGLPNGVLGSNSAGPGRKGGIGTGCCGGAGPGHDGEGGDETGIGGHKLGGRARVLPQLLWKTEPEYSEEARKAHYQGSVMLALEVDSEGKPRNIRVVKSLGLGLDEQAIQAVTQWRFKPGLLDGRPVKSPVSVEVSFRLL